MVRWQVLHGQPGVSADGQHDVVEVMGDAARQRAQCLHLLRLQHGTLHLLARMNVRAHAHHAQRHSLRVALQPSTRSHPQHRAIRMNDAIFHFIVLACAQAGFQRRPHPLPVLRMNYGKESFHWIITQCPQVLPEQERDCLIPDCLFVGDNIEADVVAAHTAGLPAMLVFTGVSSREDLAATPGLGVEHVDESVAALVDAFAS